MQGVATYLRWSFYFVDIASSFSVSECSDVGIWNEKDTIDLVYMFPC